MCRAFSGRRDDTRRIRWMRPCCGTTVVGIAAQSDIARSGKLGSAPRIADAVIAVGSPGMQADHSAGLEIDTQYVYQRASVQSLGPRPEAQSLWRQG
ncbi:alpha/beta hydrolase [Streptomyces parvus]|uniref:DUF1023 domain-containing protein n=1 Tax=Streptomyces parvus TaxID=66428 RepID=A0A5D4JHK6_9ACTN|nr:hypothetical protein FY004_11875 [Streptomyces parvus]